MESENTMVNDANTETGPVESGNENTQVETEKKFTQSELNEIISKRVAQATKKYAGVDLDEYKELKSLQNQVEEEQLIKRQEFDKVLQKTKQASAKEVQQLRSELESIKVDGALISAASEAKSVNPSHVANLLRQSVKLSDDGTVTVVDEQGNARFNDKGDNLSVAELVNEFLDQNSYFKSAGPSGAGSDSNTNTRTSKDVSLSNLDLTRADHRAIYKEMKVTGKL